MTPHSHISPMHGIAVLLFVVAALGTIHLLALTADNRASRAWFAMGL